MSCEEIMRRKLLCITIAVTGGIAYFYCFETVWIPFSVLSLQVLFMVVKGRKCEFAKTLAILLSCFLAGSFLLYRENARADQTVFEDGQRIEAYCLVTEITQKDKNSYQLCVKIGGEKLLLSYYRELKNYPALTGCTVKVRCTTEKPAAAGNPRTFDYSLYLKSRKIYTVAFAESIEFAAPPSGFYNNVKNRVFCAREQMLSDMNLTGGAEGFLRGVLFGDTKGLNEEIYQEFRENSTAHILAVSGLHIGILYGIYKKLYRRKKNPVFTAAFAAVLLLYGTTTLWSVSVSRAAVLILCSLAADFLNRRFDMLTALSFAALLSIGRNPYVIFGAGFQMSFLAVLCIVFLTPKIEKYIGAGSAAAVSVQLGLMPYMAYTFNYISLTGFLCNIPVVFLVSVLVPLGIGIFFLYLGTGLMPPLLPDICEGLSIMTVKVNHLFASVDIFSADTVSPPLAAVVLLYIVLFFTTSEYFFVYFKRKDFKSFFLPAAAAVLAAAVSVYAGFSVFDRASAVFVDVGQGDCLHLKTAEGRNIFIDGGGSIRYNVGERTLKPYLLKNGVRSLDLAAATHLHTDHFLGLSQLAEVFPVRAFLTEGEAGQRFSIGEDQWLELLWPLKKDADSDDENLNSLIFRVYLRGLTILVTGDITEKGEELLLERYQGTDKLSADILKVAHHGSNYSTCDRFLETVNPEVAVISVGKNNYGHPGDKVIEKLQKKGIMIFRTDRDGAVGVISDRKGKFSICTGKRKSTDSRCFQKTLNQEKQKKCC